MDKPLRGGGGGCRLSCGRAGPGAARYAQETTVHGLRYLVEAKNPIVK